MFQLFGEATDDLLSQFTEVRTTTLELFKPLNVEDAVIQSSTFGSPPNWHIAHVTWFFQKILEKYGEQISSDDSVNLEYLNSYYQKFGNILPKSERGKFPRPTVNQSIKYRSFIEGKIISFLKSMQSSNKLSEELKYDILLANQHEMQHQELMIYDFQHYFNRFPNAEDNYKPLRVHDMKSQHSKQIEKPTGMVRIPGGIYELGFKGDHFCYDNETPEHKAYLNPYKIDIAPVSNREFMDFINDNGYGNSRHWLADGWDQMRQENWSAPLYWDCDSSGVWMKKDFRGLRKIDPYEPVTNISYYEADAYAKWAGKRLPTEAEWEKAASWNEDRQKKSIYPWGNDNPTPIHTNLLESYLWGPSRIGTYPGGKSYYGCHQMIGDVWEWTASEYTLYPGFKSMFSEYTDKWAINQKVLRGGSFATPSKQIRNTYRNYFKPHERILFAGFRCAEDV
jgi:ergothioneine biosynthesis protein EgtB